MHRDAYMWEIPTRCKLFLINLFQLNYPLHCCCRYSALGPVWAETRAQSGDWYGSGTLHPGQVLRGILPLLSPAFRRSHPYEGRRAEDFSPLKSDGFDRVWTRELGNAVHKHGIPKLYLLTDINILCILRILSSWTWWDHNMHSSYGLSCQKAWRWPVDRSKHVACNKTQ